MYLQALATFFLFFFLSLRRPVRNVDDALRNVQTIYLDQMAYYHRILGGWGGWVDRGPGQVASGSKSYPEVNVSLVRIIYLGRVRRPC